MQRLLESDDPTSYEDEDGPRQALTALAPIEETSPLGYNVNFINATLLNTSAMIGMGIFSTPSFVLRSVGSIGMLIALYSFVPLTTMVFAKHVLHGFDAEVTPLRQRSIAIFMSTMAIGVCLFSNRWALRVNGIAALFNIGCLVLISVTGFACLFGWTSVSNSGNLKHPFDGTLYGANPYATSIVKVHYSFVGWNTILGLMAEVKGRHPVRTIQRAGIVSLLITTLLFITTLLSFSIVLTKEELLNANEVLGTIFLRKVYGDTTATKLFPILVGISAFGGIVSGDTVVFLIDLASYPALVFSLLIGCGVWILRRRRQQLGLPEHAYRAPDFMALIYVVQSIALLIMPWIPPKDGSKGGDVGFFYATYCVVAVLLLLLCGLYYWVRVHALPQLQGYELVEETISLPGGVRTIVLKKVAKGQLADQEEPLLQGELGS
ncbi:Cytochrome c oxidase subunit 1 [Rhizoctonia solani]|uniref:Cytochrome c oxidase subunit 1 n=1 Tax=Rhizoctonia solani TaxID=456999 RepID=A0A0K6GEM9_9AGAM|nr:Cytochrome c oxidase subunit 1 [Rhizoctonia solani]